MAFWQRVSTLPGVSEPSRVVRSIIAMESFKPATLAAVLMERVPSLSTRSWMETSSIVGELGGT